MKNSKHKSNFPIFFEKKTSKMITYMSGVLIFSALILTLSLAINQLFVDLKEKYFETHRTKFIANLIYIFVLVFLIIGGIITLRYFNIDLDVTSLV